MSAIFEFIGEWTAAHCSGGEEGLDAALWERFGCERTVLVVDMEGFTALTRERGIVHYLRLIQRMQTISVPLLEAHGGQLVRFEADNLSAVFPQPGKALTMMAELIRVCEEDNRDRQADDQVHVSAGLDHGAILLDESDFFGAPVNMASKLGEDLARSRDVLATQVVVDRLEGAGFCFKEVGQHEFAGTPEPTFRLELV